MWLVWTILMVINIMPVSVFAGMDHPACLPILVGGISGPCPLHGDFLRKVHAVVEISIKWFKTSCFLWGEWESSLFILWLSEYLYHRAFYNGNLLRGKVHWDEELTWEKNYALNLGLDIGLFSRVNVSLDWYTRTTKDLLMSKQLNSISGFSSLLTNVGQMRNTGVELEVRSNNIKTKDFSWTTAFNLSHNKIRFWNWQICLGLWMAGMYVRKVIHLILFICVSMRGWILRLEVPCIMITNRMRMAIIPK